MSFRYAVGDFIAVGNLVSRTIQILVASRDASSDCQTFVATLRSIESSMNTARVSLRVSFGRQDTSNAVKLELNICQKLFENFLMNYRKYTEDLCNGEKKSFLERELRKISRDLFKPDDVQKLQRNLQWHLQALEVLVMSISW
ncbi:hypothetical protein BDV12DRAFT_199968 [Aspergillus spectabilis]